jgi:hypothetical protein
VQHDEAAWGLSLVKLFNSLLCATPAVDGNTGEKSIIFQGKQPLSPVGQVLIKKKPRHSKNHQPLCLEGKQYMVDAIVRLPFRGLMLE